MGPGKEIGDSVFFVRFGALQPFGRLLSLALVPRNDQHRAVLTTRS